MFEVIVPAFILRGEGKAEECRVELSLEGNGVKGGEGGGAAVEGWKRLSGKTMGILAGVPW